MRNSNLTNIDTDLNDLEDVVKIVHVVSNTNANNIQTLNSNLKRNYGSGTATSASGWNSGIVRYVRIGCLVSLTIQGRCNTMQSGTDPLIATGLPQSVTPIYFVVAVSNKDDYWEPYDGGTTLKTSLATQLVVSGTELRMFYTGGINAGQGLKGGCIYITNQSLL